jgi:hypothetical protein
MSRYVTIPGFAAQTDATAFTAGMAVMIIPRTM